MVTAMEGDMANVTPSEQCPPRPQPEGNIAPEV